MPASRLATPHRSQLNVMCPGAAGASLGNVVYGLPPRYGNEWFVDVNSGSDGNDGRSWEEAYTTIQKAVDMAETGDTIFVAPGVYTEDIVTRDYNADVPQNDVKLVGCSGGGRPWRPIVTASTITEPALLLQAARWTVSSLRFKCRASNYGIRAVYDDSGSGGDNAMQATIEDCIFTQMGSGGTTYAMGGIDLRGAPQECTIRRNFFEFLHNAASDARCIANSDSHFAIPYRTHILDNIFQDCDRAIDFGERTAGANGSIVVRNIIGGTGKFVDMNVCIDMGQDTNGGANLVMGNWLGGTYSHDGGYWESGGVGGEDIWDANYAEIAAANSGGMTDALPG